MTRAVKTVDLFADQVAVHPTVSTAAALDQLRELRMQPPGETLNPQLLPMTDFSQGHGGGHLTWQLLTRLCSEQPTRLGLRFFGPANVESIHQYIRYLVHRQTGQRIGQQQSAPLVDQMASVYRTSGPYDPTQLERECTRLNELTIRACVTQVVGKLREFERYRQSFTRPTPLALPASANRKGTSERASRPQPDFNLFASQGSSGGAPVL